MIICYLIGDRTLEECRAYFKKLLGRVSSKPLFTSDELADYKTALQENFSTVVPPPPTGKRGRPRKGAVVIDNELDYAVVHKTRERGKVTKVEQKVVFGSEEKDSSKAVSMP